jgi:membrane protein
VGGARAHHPHCAGLTTEREWVSAGAALAIAGWIGASIAFGLYVAYIANFQSPYGNLVSVMVLMAYVYWLALMFLVGVLADVVLAGHRGSSLARSTSARSAGRTAAR